MRKGVNNNLFKKKKDGNDQPTGTPAVPYPTAPISERGCPGCGMFAFATPPAAPQPKR